jgi:arylsulfatase A-like enzyme
MLCEDYLRRAWGEVRDQYHHSTDIVPTILDVCGLEMPKVFRGVEQYPLSGVSMRYIFDSRDAPTAALDSIGSERALAALDDFLKRHPDDRVALCHLERVRGRNRQFECHDGTIK